MEIIITHLIIGIDATNISSGGGITHLIEILKVADPVAHKFSYLVIWSSRSTLNIIDDKPWIIKIHSPLLDKSLPFRVYYQNYLLSDEARKLNCSILLVLGGTFLGNFSPFVVMCRNMLPFETKEIKRYILSFAFFRLIFLRFTQVNSFNKADGVIFLSKYAMKVVNKQIKKTINFVVIPHGIDNRFYRHPRKQNQAESYSFQNPFRILYVSKISLYKHQWHVAKAVALLRKDGFPVLLDLVGPSNSLALKKFNNSLKAINNYEEYIHYLGPISFNDLHNVYKSADMFLYASSCENLPNVLLEGMASGLPIACSNYGPMPEVLGNAGVYFDPEKPEQIAAAIKMLFLNHEIRNTIAKQAYEKSKNYSWKTCANATFTYISQVV